MKFILKDDNRLSIIHGDEDLIFSISFYKQTSLNNIVDPYLDLNEWLMLQPKEVQTALFETYKEISMAMLGVRDPDTLGDMLEQFVGVIYKYITYESIEKFCRASGRIRIPPQAYKEVHDPNDKMPDRTYLVSDCWHLAVLAICLRPMVPIWARYTQLLDKLVGNNFKEHIAVTRLLGNTWVMEAIPIQRLRRYINILLIPANLAPAAYSGISKEEFPEWLLGLVLVRKVCIGDVIMASDRGSLISGIYNFITQTLKGLDARFVRVGDKGGVKQSSSEDDISVLDGSRVRQNDTIGMQVAREEYTKKIYVMTRHIDPTVPLELIANATASPPDYSNRGISEFHMRATQWVVANAFPAVHVEALHKEYRVNLLMVTRILLWHWGHHELSLLVSAPMQPVDSDAIIDGIGSSHRTRVKQELIDELLAPHPYGQKDTAAIREGRMTKNTHYIYRATVIMKDLIPNRVWKTTPILGTDPGDKVDSLGIMSTPEDIHSLVVKLAIDIGKRRSNLNVQ